MNNKDDKKPDQAKDVISTGLGSSHKHPGGGGPPMHAPFDPVADMPSYPVQPGFTPGYQPGQSGYPGQTTYPGYQDYIGQPGIASSCQNMELARAYILIQSWGQVNSPSQALETGTLFPELYRPCKC